MANETKLSAAQELHSKSIVIDSCSFFCQGYDDRLERSGITALVLTTPWPHDNFDDGVQRIEEYYQLADKDPRLCLIETAEDIREAKRNGQVGLILAAQNSSTIGDRLSRVQTMARLGLRVMQLTYNERNHAGDGCNEPTDAGLSIFGRSLVSEMNRHGILLDVSHAGARTASEAVAASDKPVIASHSNPFTLYPSGRNLSDELIDAISESGGVIGISPYGPINWDGDPEHPPTLENMMKAIDYIVERAGIDHVGIGSDREATKGAYPAELQRKELSTIHESHSTPTAYREAFKHLSKYPIYRIEEYEGIHDHPKFAEALVRRGYGSEDVMKILGGNYLRVFEEVWPN